MLVDVCENVFLNTAIFLPSEGFRAEHEGLVCCSNASFTRGFF